MRGAWYIPGIYKRHCWTAFGNLEFGIRDDRADIPPRANVIHISNSVQQISLRVRTVFAYLYLVHILH